MAEQKRPVSYQQTLGTKTEQTRRDNSEQNQHNVENEGNNLQKSEANFPE